MKAEKVTPTDVFSTLQVYLGSQYERDFNYPRQNIQGRRSVEMGEFVRTSQRHRSPEGAKNTSGEMVPIKR